MYVREERSVIDRVFDFTQEMYTHIIHTFIQKHLILHSYITIFHCQNVEHLNAI